LEAEKMDIDAYNPYPSFQPGQKEAITQILDLYDAGEKVVELNAPTAAGKSLDLFVLGRVLTEELDVGRVVYTTPLVALVNQLQDTKAFEKMPVLKGKRNYPCGLLRASLGGWQTADDCPFKNWTDAMQNSEGAYCRNCEYHKAYAKFIAKDFGATTLARFQMGGAIHDETTVLLVDESAGLEKTLIDRATLVLTERIDLDHLVPSLTVYYHELEKEASELDAQIGAAKGNLRKISELIKLRNRAEREARKTAKVLAHIEHEHPYIIDKERKFRLLDGRSEFRNLVEHLDFCVLASGTPATSILTTDYAPVVIQHPIPVERRICFYWPIGSMNYKERQTTAPRMADAIAKLHQGHGKKTMVHCGAYVIAKMLHDNFPAAARKKCILQDQQDREGSKSKFLAAKEAIFLSVNFEEGLDLKGPDYPLNIIAKVPFENIGDEFVKARNERDNYKRYNMHAAVAVMQAAGRCTRAIDDFSETYILDASWQGFFNRSKKLFQPWFVASLKRYQETSLEAWAQ
jgi:Rad3-related DNA helicase